MNQVMAKEQEKKKNSPRIQWLREYYFSGAKRKWNNEYTVWSTGTPWDLQYHEFTYYIVPETYLMFDVMRGGYAQAARTVPVEKNFFNQSIAQRRAAFVKEVMVNHLPQEILPGDLIAGGRFNILTSMCLTRKEQADYNKRILGKAGVRARVKWFHDHGYGNCGATSGHLVPGHEQALKLGWKGIHQQLSDRLNCLKNEEKSGHEAAQLKAMLTAATMAGELARKYSQVCTRLMEKEKEEPRKKELEKMAAILKRVPWEPAGDFWEAVQALWLNHMLIMSDENYPGPGVSLGRIDQFLLPYWEKSKAAGMDREFAKEILKCFWIHCNTAYDATIRCGNQGITAGYGQLITLSGMGPDGQDLTNELTYMILEVIDELSPILEPKPNVRLHRRTPEKLYDHCIAMISQSQGAPFLLNFDERSMAGMLVEGEKANIPGLIHEKNVHDYAPVGCLENTMVGNDRSGTVDNNLNILKAVELVLTRGKDLVAYTDPMTGKKEKIKQDGPDTGNPEAFTSFDQFMDAFKIQMGFIVKKCADLYEMSESVRQQYFATPYLSCLVKGCMEKGRDVTDGGAQISFTTLEAVTYATTVDSLLAVKHLVYDEKACTVSQLIAALKANWKGHEILQAKAKNRAPKYGRDDDRADSLAREVMAIFCNETWKHKTRSTGRQFRPGMLSWNYWAGDGHVMAASADGREQGQFLSNAICPSNGADIKGPTANSNSVGKVLGGKLEKATGDFREFVNDLPNGASHTITFNPSLLKDPDHKDKFKAFLKGYNENGGTALQINMLDPDLLRDAQKNPEDHRHLLVRITGYNAYFTSIGKELQDEVIKRISHGQF
jgi:formate C-acetyltransferase